MSLIVVKFGGTSVADPERIISAASIVASLTKEWDKIIVVVSAMAGATNKLVSLCRDLSNLDSPVKRAEYDVALSTGETLSASLFALALSELGVNARSLQAWQANMISNEIYNSALITDLDIKLLGGLLDNGIVPVVTGFQAVTASNRIATIGRGGSDTSAAAIASAMRADFCDIYTDVDGMYTSDPRLVHDASLISEISYEETLELAGMGAKILHPRSVEICMRYNIPMRIFSSFTKKTGTIIMSNIDEINKITAISHLKKLAVIKIKSKEISLSDLIKDFAANEINIHQIIRSDEEMTILSVQYEYLDRAKLLLSEKFKNNKEVAKCEEDISIIGIVGAAIRHDSAVLIEILNILEANAVKPIYILNSEIKVTLYLKEDNIERVVKLLHNKLINHE